MSQIGGNHFAPFEGGGLWQIIAPDKCPDISLDARLYSLLIVVYCDLSFISTLLAGGTMQEGTETGF